MPNYSPRSGRIQTDDGQTHNIVDLLGGGTPITSQAVDINSYAPQGDKIIGEDGNIYSLVSLLQGVGGGTVSWEDVQNKPTSFPPQSHTHEISEVNNLQTELNSKLTASQAAAVADSVDAPDVATLEEKMNELLAALRAAGIIAT
ncbi:hypothetical protein [Paludifilum halophilum]|uniref:Head fiber protein n=1 Tax=Paludifilum halophilum TaxID=1642702 RepID=A0A235B1C0_9BACL|nr:hypothetical protein [Paludifilum halophilum]OYD06098.1 hypothetical protein CHM34_18110 [Paludifilum halophilum]